MKALRINRESRSIESIDISSHADLAGLIGYDTLEPDAVGTAGDRLYFDEERFLRDTRRLFQIDSIIPVSGHAVIVGTSEDGSTLRDATTTIDDLRTRTKYP